MKLWKSIFILLGIIPFGFIFSLLTFYFHAGYILGRLPIYDKPDPKFLSIYNLYAPWIDITGEVWLISLFIWLFIMVIYLIINRKSTSWKLLLYSSIGYIIAILLFLSGIMEWYSD
jgi:hypothetical protein